MSIPRIIHQTWKTKVVPEELFRREWVESWPAKHPGWDYILWTDEENRRFIRDRYPWFLPVFDGYDRGIKRADAVRYFLLHHFGGVYADLDFQCLKNVEPLLAGHKIVLGRMGEGLGDPHSIPNAFMASEKGHPFWLRLADELVKRKDLASVERSTGPVLLRDMVVRHFPGSIPGPPEASSGLKIWESRYLYPIDWHVQSAHRKSVPERTLREAASIFPDAFAVTFWTHCWSSDGG